MTCILIPFNQIAYMNRTIYVSYDTPCEGELPFGKIKICAHNCLNYKHKKRFDETLAHN